MGLEKVKQEILGNARKEAEAVIEAAQAESRSIVKAAETQAAENERVAEEKLQKSFDSLKRKEVASAELELQKQMLAARSELIEQAFRDAAKGVGSLSEKKREAHIAALLEQARKEMPVAVVHCSGRDARLVESVGGGRVKIIKNDDMLGGIIAESLDGKLRADYSYEAILEQVRSKVLGDVARALFSK